MNTIIKSLIISRNFSNYPRSILPFSVSIFRGELDKIKQIKDVSKINCDYAFEQGHLNIVEWLIKNKREIFKTKYQKERIASKLAEANQLEGLKFLKKHKILYCDNYTCRKALFEGNVECFEYLFLNHKVRKYCDSFFKQSVKEACYDCLVYWLRFSPEFLDTNNTKYEKILKYCFENYSSDPFEVDMKFIYDKIYKGDLKFVKFLINAGHPTDEWCYALAAFSANLEMSIYLRENGCKWDTWTSIFALRNGDLKLLNYVFKNKCPFDRKLWEWTLANPDFDKIIERESY